MKLQSKQADRQAEKWTNALMKMIPVSAENAPVIANLASGAFLLYKREWPGMQIDAWNWPFDCLDEITKRLKSFNHPAAARTTLASMNTFDNDNPWTILLREAVLIAMSR